MTPRTRSSSVRRFAPILRIIHRVMLIAGLCLSSWPVFVSAESLWAQWSAERELAAMAAKVAIPKADRPEAIIPGKPGELRPVTRPRGSVLGRFEVPRLQL